jgi:hypothetical protein
MFKLGFGNVVFDFNLHSNDDGDRCLEAMKAYGIDNIDYMALLNADKTIRREYHGQQAIVIFVLLMVMTG